MVLVADGDQACADALCEALKADGHQVEVACDEEGVFACLAASRPDVVVIDTFLGPADGLELVSRLRSSMLASTPVVLTTALSEAEVRRGGAARLVAAIVPKPFQLESVLELVRACREGSASLD